MVPETSYATIIGRLIYSAREAQGVDQATLAHKVGVGQSTWSRIERGESGFSVEQLRLAAEALKISPGHILSEADRAAERLTAEGVKVHAARPTINSETVIAWIGVAALGVLIAALLRK